MSTILFNEFHLGPSIPGVIAFRTQGSANLDQALIREPNRSIPIRVGLTLD